MKKVNKTVLRLDAGEFYGLGHLSRCLSLAKKIDCTNFLFIIKTDNQKIVKDFMLKNFIKKHEILFLSRQTGCLEEIDIIIRNYEKDTVLIVDHYNANEDYQKQLFDHEIHWLQLDSHAKYRFYADYVMHGSPGATEELYEPLKINNKLKLLLGPKYCIIKDEVLKLGKGRQKRQELRKVIICFGGGDDRGVTLECLKVIDFDAFPHITFLVSINRYNKNYEQIVDYQLNERIQIIDQDNLHQEMHQADLALIAPGMISYEAAYLGLPMLLITIADNQVINSKAWEKANCAINIGNINDIKNNLNNKIIYLYQNSNIIKKMSENCLTLVDGNGSENIINAITEEL